MIDDMNQPSDLAYCTSVINRPIRGLAEASDFRSFGLKGSFLPFKRVLLRGFEWLSPVKVGIEYANLGDAINRQIVPPGGAANRFG